MGRFEPVIEKPLPETAAELTLTGAVPVDDRTTVWVVAEFITTLPKEMLLALIVNVGTAAFNCRAKPIEALPEEAVIVAD
jgi:hypothetical protein